MRTLAGDVQAALQHLAGLPNAQFGMLVVVLAVLTLLGGYFGFRFLARARLIADTPTSRIASAAQGYVEIEGNADLLPGPEIVAPLSKRVCAWWRFRVEKKVTTYSGGKRRTEWKTISKGTSDALFLLRDGSGDCIVDPHGATITPSLRQRWRGPSALPPAPPVTRQWLQFGRYRFTEHLIQRGDALYALGFFRTQNGVQEFNERDAVRELIREWKHDHAQLLIRFDADRDGSLDLDEWEAVRSAALAEVRNRHVHQAVTPDLNVLSRPPDGRPYLLSTRTEAQLIGDKQWNGWSLVTLALVSFVLVATLLELRFAP